ncbi:MAG: flavohemoglobin expression-modulating QEGLA motif protein [Patescibacteria group bacterium]|nr:flavohemoglobin expression-modulating QEGLA motif protein [Patescibacteria group bacterium]
MPKSAKIIVMLHIPSRKEEAKEVKPFTLDDVLDFLALTLNESKIFDDEQDVKDKEEGKNIPVRVAAAKKIGRFLMGDLVTDGGVKCPNPEAVWQAYLKADTDSEKEEQYAYTLSLINLLRTIHDALSKSEQDGTRALQMDRFTKANEEFNEIPDSALASSLLARLTTDDNGEPTQFAEKLKNLGLKVDQITDNKLEERLKKIESIKEPIDEWFDNKYPEVTSVFDKARKEQSPEHPTMLESEKVFDLYEQALAKLKATDSQWSDWEVELVEDKDLLLVNCREKKIKVGKKRRAMTINEAEGLFRHEVLVHALRSINGAKLGPDFKDFELGLVGYLFTEEGLGVLVEYAENGEEALEKPYDRYTDIALALGLITDSPIPKDVLYDILMAREKDRAKKAGKEFDEESARKKLRPHINRIYRGSEGDDVVGVFTKDIAYFGGFIKIAEYILDRIEKGDRINVIMKYILSGKFDPTNEIHTNALEKAQKVNSNLI